MNRKKTNVQNVAFSAFKFLKPHIKINGYQLSYKCMSDAEVM